MNKEGKMKEVLNRLYRIKKAIKQSYLYKLISKFLSVVCTIILILLLVVGAFMFYFNMKAKSYEDKGMEYTAPFGLYTIISGSMEPNVSVYDVVIAVEKDIGDIKVGDVITFISSWDINYGVTVTHRVVGISKNESGEYQLTTKGDNNGSIDGGTVTQNNLVGKVVGRIPQLGRLQFFLATKMGWFLVVFIPAMIIIIIDMIKIFKLYVLKNDIDNIKTHKEAKKMKLEEIMEEKKPPVEPPKEPVPVKEESTIKKETMPLPAIKEPPKDKNIDTVELPKIGEDGIIKENTAELPVIKSHRDFGETTSFKDIEIKKEEPVIENKDTAMPLLKKANSDDNIEIDNLDIQRKMLKRRNDE